MPQNRSQLPSRTEKNILKNINGHCKGKVIMQGEGDCRLDRNHKSIPFQVPTLYDYSPPTCHSSAHRRSCVPSMVGQIPDACIIPHEKEQKQMYIYIDRYIYINTYRYIYIYI